MHFLEIYYSSFSRNTIYSKPKDVRFLADALNETRACFYLRTKAVVIFVWKKGHNETYLNFQRLDFVKDRDKIDELIRKGTVKQQVLELK